MQQIVKVFKNYLDWKLYGYKLTLSFIIRVREGERIKWASKSKLLLKSDIYFLIEIKFNFQINIYLKDVLVSF